MANEVISFPIATDEGSATNLNGPLRQVMTQSGLNPDAGFPGFAAFPVLGIETGVTAPQHPYGDARRFGALGDGITNDKAALKNAVASCPVGGEIVIPRTSAHFYVDISGGHEDAIIINKAMTVVIDGIVESSIGAIEPDPPSIFRVTAAGVTFKGTGTIRGDGNTNDVNTGSDTTLPSLLRVEADAFTMDGLTIDTPYKIGVYLYSCYNAKIVNNKFTGGPTSYSDTSYFGIRGNQGGRHVISDNQFYPDAGGGMYVSCIFLNNTNHCVVGGNVAYRPYEKLVYGSASYNVIIGNTVIGKDPAAGKIAGTNYEGTVGAVYRVDGMYNKIIGNFSQYGGGAQSLGGKGSDISGNTFIDAGQSGITVTSGGVTYENITIKDNIITCANLVGVVVTNGIYIEPSGTPGVSYQIQVSGNIVKGFSKSDPYVNVVAWQATTTYPKHSTIKPTVANGRYYALDTTHSSGGQSGGSEPNWATALSAGQTVNDGAIRWVCMGTVSPALQAQINLTAPSAGNEFSRATIANNNLSTGDNGILTTFMINSSVYGNQIHAAQWGIIETSGGTNRYRMNPVEGAANAGISGLASTSVTDTPVDWTPRLSDGTNTAPNPGSGSNAGTVTRIGRRVLLSGQIATSTLVGSPGTVSGSIRITGLPVAAAAGIKNRAVLSVGLAGGFNIAAGQSVTGYIDGGTDYIQLYLWDAATGSTPMQASEWSDDGNMIFSLEYNAANE